MTLDCFSYTVYGLLGLDYAWDVGILSYSVYKRWWKRDKVENKYEYRNEKFASTIFARIIGSFYILGLRNEAPANKIIGLSFVIHLTEFINSFAKMIAVNEINYTFLSIITVITGFLNFQLLLSK